MTGLRESAQGAKTIFFAGILRTDGVCVGAAVESLTDIYIYYEGYYLPDAAIHEVYVEKSSGGIDFMGSGSHDICAGHPEGAGGSVPGAGQQFEGSSVEWTGGV